MSYPVFEVPAGDVLPVMFSTYAGATGASATLSGLAVTDIEIYKDGSTTQRASDAGYTLLDTDGIDFDGITGIHGFSIDTGDNTDAGFYTVGAWFTVVVSAVTIDSQTVNFIACQFRIKPAESSAGVPKVDVSHFGGSVGTFSGGRPEVNTTHAAGTAWGSGAITAGSIATGAITAAKFASGAIDAAALAADAVGEIADGVWDEAIAGHAGAGSTGEALSAAGGAGDPWITALPGSYSAGQAGYILGTYLDAAISSRLAASTDGSGLTAIPWNAAWDAEVQSECTDALNAYDPPTNAELSTAVGAVTLADGSLTAAKIAAGAITAGKLAAGAIDAAALAADAAQEIRDAVWATTFSELTTDPGATPAASDAIMLGYMALRNKRDTDSSGGTDEIHNNAGTVILTATISDSGTLFTKGKYAP